jgi:hypothetical protein
MVRLNSNINSTTVAQLFGAVTSTVLSFALVVLYYRQMKIQKRQEELLEKRHSCLVVGYLDESVNLPKIVLENIGPSAAYDVNCICRIGDHELRFETPLLSKDEKVSDTFRIGSGGDVTSRHGLNTGSLLEKIESSEIPEDIEIEVTYRNSLHHSRHSVWTRNLRERLESFDSERYQSPSSELEKIRREIDRLGKRLE